MRAPNRYRPPARRTPIVVWANDAWRPGLVLEWRQDEAEGWCCRIRFRDKTIDC
jgi:hypothetical protein